METVTVYCQRCGRALAVLEADDDSFVECPHCSGSSPEQTDLPFVTPSRPSGEGVSP